jgi:hypothetical protein
MIYKINEGSFEVSSEINDLSINELKSAKDPDLSFRIIRSLRDVGGSPFDVLNEIKSKYSMLIGSFRVILAEEREISGYPGSYLEFSAIDDDNLDVHGVTIIIFHEEGKYLVFRITAPKDIWNNNVSYINKVIESIQINSD